MSRRTWTAVRAALCTSSRMAALPDDSCRLFYAQLILVADSYGCIDARPHKLLATVWPLLGKTVEETARCVRELERVGLVVRKRDARDEWLAVPDWEEKQAELIRRRGKRAFGADPEELEGEPRETPPPGPEEDEEEPRGPGVVRESPGVALTSRISPLQSSLAEEPSGASRSPRAREAHPPANSAPRPRSNALPPEPDAPSGRARDQLAMHPSLDVEPVRDAIVRWESHLREHGKSPWGSGTWATNLAKWSRWGPERAVRAIDTSIGAGAFSVFEPRHGEAPPPSSKPAPSAAETRAKADRAAYERELERRWESLHTVEREVPSPLGGTVKRLVLDARYPGHEAAERELRGLGLISGNPPVFAPARKESAA